MVRRAKIKDVPAIVTLISDWAQKGDMLGRSRLQVYTALRDFVVIEEDEQIIACGALHIVWDDIAEIRSLAVNPEHLRKGYGRQIVDFLLRDARELECPKIFSLTYKPEFFKKFGFQEIDKSELPHKVWKDCINCPKFPDCDEIAMLHILAPSADHQDNP
ncbi:MAG TPA: N-acetyltransferase [bacterium]|nr:N-acetyltransferase [bacterium]HNT64892.1 N-acetyltransferase [bacterium]HOX84941.1 N-acetyltransferase [bacterium]HPG44193.1 N-acetyltransferase [bacterium]HPM96560.1 N-acetyltransferase [bacterium]